MFLQEWAAERAVRERDPMTTAFAEVRGGSPNATDEELRALARMYVYGLSPGDEYAYARMNLELDVRHVLSAIAVPTLVLQNAEDNWVPVESGRELAGLIPGSTYVEVPIRGHIPALADMDVFLEPIESFLRESWEAAGDGTRAGTRARDSPLHRHRRFDHPHGQRG